MNNREIKYQCWDKKRKRMYEVLHLHIDNTMGQGAWATVKGYDVINQKDIHLQVQPENACIRESTGLKDKNGVNVYEGDVVKWLNPQTEIEGLSEVRYNGRLARFQIIDGEVWYGINPPIQLEVLGNIYEHPDLLNL